MALMKRHLRISSFWKDYTKWTHHGETTPVAGVDDVAPQDGMGNVIEDVRGERMEEDTYLNQQNSNGDSGGVRDDFEDLVKEAETELYPGCTKYSSIDFLAKLMNVKDTYHLTNEAFDRILFLLRDSMPEGNMIPPSYYVAKKTFKKIGLAYEMIDVCTNDCALFWKENEFLQNCPIC